MTPTRLNMAAYCLATAPHRDDDTVALIVVHDHRDPTRDAERWTYRELRHAVLACGAGLLRAGLRPGQRVVLRLPNTSDFPLLHFGALAVGIVPVPTSSQLTAEEVDFVAADCGAAAVASADAPTRPGCLSITPADVAAWREAGPGGLDFADTAADDPAFVVYTSGTTGVPKGVVHAHRSAWGRRPMYDGWYGIGPQDVMLHAGAFNWTYTLGVGLTDPWAVGATAVVDNSDPAPGAWPRVIAATGATLFAAVPGIYRRLLAAGVDRADLATLRHGLTAGEALPPTLWQRWRQATGLELYEALGMSEISTFISCGPTTPTRPGSPGRPQPGRRVAVLPLDGGDQPVPDGEHGLLAVHRDDPGLMLGYLDRPQEDAAARRGDWFVSADVVHLDPDGYVVHHGRADDVMTASGYRVSPLEVEHVVESAPGVAEVAVTQVAVREDVEVITAFVVPRDSHTVDEDAVLAHARAHLARYKCPRRVVVLAALPRTSRGKVSRAALRERG